jgi:hypothetical protein
MDRCYTREIGPYSPYEGKGVVSMTRVKQTIGIDDARDGRAATSTAYVVRAAILVAVLAFMVTIFSDPAEAAPCDEILDPECETLPPEPPPGGNTTHPTAPTPMVSVGG